MAQLRTSELHLPPGEHYDPSARGAGTLPRSWARHWNEAPERSCLIEVRERDVARLSYGELADASAQVAGRLLAAGLQAGDRVLSSAQSSLDLVIAHVACMRAGLVVIPTNTAYREAELRHVVGDARPRAALIDEPERARALERADASLLIFGPEVAPLDGAVSEAADVTATALDVAAPGAPALIGYTSGTTGRPKGAVLSHANLLASVEALRLAWRWTPEDRLLLALPLFHMHGLGVGLHGTLHAGASAVLMSHFDPDVLLDAAGDHAGTLFFGVPTMVHRLANSLRGPELARLRLCVSGSAPLPAELHRRFEALTGQRILERYGMTETAMLVSNPHDYERRPGSVGVALPGVEVRLRGEPAEIEVRGPNVFAGYWERPDANREAFTEDGWFRTGDLGQVDGGGYLCIAGRSKELIISGGYNVYPREVEDALREHPAVEDAAVVGAASAEWGERVCAYLVAREGASLPSLAQLREFLAERLAAYKHPRELHGVDALPRNALGKVQKHRLSEGGVTPD